MIFQFFHMGFLNQTEPTGKSTKPTGRGQNHLIFVRALLERLPLVTAHCR